MADNYRLVPETKSEEDLLKFIENHIEYDKAMVLAVVKDLRDNLDTGSNNAGKCYEGCPPQIGDDFLNSWIEELDAPEKELFLLRGWDAVSFSPFKGWMGDERLTDFPKAEDVFFFKNGSSYLDSHQGIFNDNRKPENNINF